LLKPSKTLILSLIIAGGVAGGSGNFTLPTTPPKGWLNLLHMRKGWFGYESEVDDPRFFLSPKGKTAPLKEMEKELNLFQSGERKKYICKFPLRYLYLRKRFNLPPFNFQNCPKLWKALQAIKPYKVSIVFADATINKPAYMFGHTFLRVDDNRTNPLISTAINYAAKLTGNDGGLAYAFKGIFGFYPGYYTPMPYYDKIKQYLENESRDLWEYRLDLSPEDAYKIILHSWELKDIYTDYYFFSENCSYELLWLIEVVRPQWGVIDHFRGKSVIPIDTIRYLYSQKGIVGVNYRPSLYTQIKVITAPLTKKELSLIKKIVEGKKSPTQVLTLKISPQRQARILDGAVRYLQYQAKKEGWSKKKYIPRFLGILKVRSKIPHISQYHYPRPFRPDLGHLSHRLSIGWGYDGVDGAQFGEIGVRGAYQGFDDLWEGFRYGSQVIFFEPVFRYYPTKHRAYLQKLTLIDLKSVVPRTTLFKPISWKVKFGLYRQPVAPDVVKNVVEVNPGGGFGWSIGGGYFYTLFQTTLKYSNYWEKNYRLGIGGEVGYLRPFGNRVQLYLSGERLQYIAPEKEKEWQFHLSTTFKLSRNTALLLKGNRQFRYRWSSQGGIYLLHYFSW
jgi:hypothetical protein